MSPSGGYETAEFRRSFLQETDTLLRRRLGWFIAIWGGLGFLGFILIAVISFAYKGDIFLRLLFGTTSVGWHKAFPPVGILLWMGAYGTALFLVLIRKDIPNRTVVHLSMMLIVFDGLFALAGRIGMVEGYNLWYFWLAHLIACLVFPWTVRQALIPIAIVLPLSVLSRLTLEGGTLGGTVLGTVWVMTILSPAVLICGIRHTQRVQRFNNRFLTQRYGMLRQELAYARQLHESLFPEPKVTGPIRFSYRYEPMRQIGGDYLYANTERIEGGEAVSVVLLDVTGHGIPAALTVNRLHGEIDLRFAEQPGIGPGELLRLLNRYIELTLAKHSIFATAVCFRFDSASGKLTYASGGHPPAFIRGIDGTLRDLDPTSFVLGACSDRDFDPGEREVDFHEGDSLIAYTDGAIEARSVQGNMLKINGLRRILAAPLPSGTRDAGLGTWSERLLAEVTHHRGGMPPEDDTLVIEIYRAIRRSDPRRPSSVGQSAPAEAGPVPAKPPGLLSP
ncbi:MAG: serine/threonine-protein phosphatase [Phycisphaerales bacterium]|nr:serine/threonine-protein phosphatase [Planctomycetota bacterium]MCH8508214.1 serine/threonine-protein phosphatase [Phycisphaerales bacterium]